MKLPDLLPRLAELADGDAKRMALVFGAEAYAVLMDAQQHRQSQHRTAPVQLTTGQWMLCADLLTEIRPGGLYADGFTLLPPETFALVSVMPWPDAVALLPHPAPTLERARDNEGRFIADDPSTPESEAWVEVEG